MIQLLQGEADDTSPIFAEKCRDIKNAVHKSGTLACYRHGQAVAEIFDANDVLKLEIAQKPNGAAMLNCGECMATLCGLRQKALLLLGIGMTDEKDDKLLSRLTIKPTTSRMQLL